MDHDILFWVAVPTTENEHTYDFAFQLKGIVGPDEKHHVIIGVSQLDELATIIETLRESYGQHQDREEEPEIFNNKEGGIIIARS